jgi:hypothetical protein
VFDESESTPVARRTGVAATVALSGTRIFWGVAIIAGLTLKSTA